MSTLTINTSYIDNNAVEQSLNGRPRDEINYLILNSSDISVYSHALADFNNLTSIAYAWKIVYLESNAFKNCTSLTSINIGNCCNIPESAFENCNSLKKVTFSNDQSKKINIEDNAFKDCTSLNVLDYESNISSIGNYAFYNCNINEKIYLNNCINIGEYAFSNNFELKNLCFCKLLWIRICWIFF